MFMPQRKPTPWLVDLLERLARYRPAPPLPGLLSEETWRLPVRAADRHAGNPPAANPPRVELAQAEPHGTEGDEVLPDGVVNQFRDRLDADGLRFLKHGPATPDERRAYGQQVRPDAHLSAAMAPADLQRRFQDTGGYDRVRYFVEPDDTLYVRDASSREMLAQRLRRGLESAVGAKKPPIPPGVPSTRSLESDHDEYALANGSRIGSPGGANAITRISLESMLRHLKWSALSCPVENEVRPTRTGTSSGPPS